jgi:hypothetical protein
MSDGNLGLKHPSLITSVETKIPQKNPPGTISASWRAWTSRSQIFR